MESDILKSAILQRSLSASDILQCKTTASQFACVHKFCSLYSQSDCSSPSVSYRGQILDEKLNRNNCIIEDLSISHPATMDRNSNLSPTRQLSSTAVKMDRTSTCSGATHLKLTAHRRCHCRACCSCSPVDRLRGACLSYGRGAALCLHQRSTSIDSGLERIVSRKSSCATQPLCRKSEAAVSSSKFNEFERLSVVPHCDTAGIAVQSCTTVAACQLSISSGISDACRSVVDDESDDQDVFLPRISSSLITDKVPALEFRQKLVVSGLFMFYDLALTTSSLTL